MGLAEFQALIERDLPMGQWLGFRVEALGDGKAVIRMPARRELMRPGGTIAGPALMTLADCAMYAVVLGMRGDAVMAVTSNLTIHFLRAPKPVDVIAEAAMLRLGRRLAVIEVVLFSEGEAEPVAHITGTYALPGTGHRPSGAVP
ncbi:MAG TPA: PaaI family thioesterase [Alphaproteobacteria bacterium]|nr:PaaI family thioesterase [Alphaproteobacteria bacterium]